MHIYVKPFAYIRYRLYHYRQNQMETVARIVMPKSGCLINSRQYGNTHIRCCSAKIILSLVLS